MTNTGQFTPPGQPAVAEDQTRGPAEADDQIGTAADDEKDKPAATEDQGGISQVAEQAQELRHEAQEKVQEAATQAKGMVREQLDHRSSELAEQVNQQASDLRAVSESLREQGKDGPARAAAQLAQYAEKVGGYLAEKDSAALLAEAEDLGRRQPLAAGAGALVLGFVASRFLKASSRRRYASRPPSRQSGTPRSSAPFAPTRPESAPGSTATTAPAVPWEAPVPDQSGAGAQPVAPPPTLPFDAASRG